MIKNKYEIDNEVTKIIIENTKGELFYVYIDTEDLNKVIKYNWHVAFMKSNERYYVTTTKYFDEYIEGTNRKKATTISLSKLITDTSKEDFIDHINHDTFDNRKSNLRIISNSNNLKNRGKLNRNNKSGYRNVSKINDKWCVQIQINGKNTLLGKFPLDKLEEAGKFAKEMREKYYKEHAGI